VAGDARAGGFTRGRMAGRACPGGDRRVGLRGCSPTRTMTAAGPQAPTSRRLRIGRIRRWPTVDVHHPRVVTAAGARDRTYLAADALDGRSDRFELPLGARQPAVLGR